MLPDIAVLVIPGNICEISINIQFLYKFSIKSINCYAFKYMHFPFIFLHLNNLQTATYKRVN